MKIQSTICHSRHVGRNPFCFQRFFDSPLEFIPVEKRTGKQSSEFSHSICEGGERCGKKILAEGKPSYIVLRYDY